MADFFIKRPILSICLSIIIVLLGTFSILRLPISEYPVSYTHLTLPTILLV